MRIATSGLNEEKGSPLCRYSLSISPEEQKIQARPLALPKSAIR